MKGLLAVIRREIAENRHVLVAAAVAGVLPIAVPLVRALPADAALEARVILAVFLAGAFAAGLALALGGTVLAPKIANRRIAFYFSKPLSTIAIWGGKLSGAFLLLLGASALTLVPTLALGGGRARILDLLASRLLPAIGAAGALVLLAHASSIAVQSRSARLALDLLFLGTFALIVWGGVSSLWDVAPGEALSRSAIALALLSFAAITAAGYAAVTSGRTDIHAAHRALSRILWTSLLTAGLLFWVHARWVLAAAPRDLDEIRLVIPAPRGSWAGVWGHARWRGDFYPAFLLDTESRRFWRVGDFPTFSLDGRRAAWLSGGPRRGPWGITTLDLTTPDARPVETKLSFRSRWLSMTLSPSGQRLAVVEPGEDRAALSVYELPSEALLVSVSTSYYHGYPRLQFLDESRVRVYAGSKGEIQEIGELDVARRRFRKTGRLGPFPGYFPFRADAAGERLLVRSSKERAIHLCDAATGACARTISTVGSNESHRADFLSDGRIAVAEATEGAARLRLLSREGAEEGAIPLGRGTSVALGGEAAPGRVVVAVQASRAQPRFDSRIFVADLDAGEARPVADHLFPVSLFGWWVGADPSNRPEPGSEATKLFYAPDGSLVRFDPLTGERRTILSGGS